MMVALCLSLSTLPASLNSWLVSATGIDPHQFHLHAPTRNHFIVNQSFWKHLTKGPGFTNKPSIPAACWQSPANEECNQHLFKNYLFWFFGVWAGGGDAGMNQSFLTPAHARTLLNQTVSPDRDPRFDPALTLKKGGMREEAKYLNRNFTKEDIWMAINTWKNAQHH